jgi:hypothetical protein
MLHVQHVKEEMGHRVHREPGERGHHQTVLKDHRGEGQHCHQRDVQAADVRNEMLVERRVQAHGREVGVEGSREEVLPGAHRAVKHHQRDQPGPQPCSLRHALKTRYRLAT